MEILKSIISHRLFVRKRINKMRELIKKKKKEGIKIQATKEGIKIQATVGPTLNKAKEVLGCQ